MALAVDLQVNLDFGVVKPALSTSCSSSVGLSGPGHQQPLLEQLDGLSLVEFLFSSVFGVCFFNTSSGDLLESLNFVHFETKWNEDCGMGSLTANSIFQI